MGIGGVIERCVDLARGGQAVRDGRWEMGWVDGRDVGSGMGTDTHTHTQKEMEGVAR